MRSIVFLLFLNSFFFFSCAKSGGQGNSPGTTTVIPALSILDVTQARDNKLTTNFRFFINLSAATTNSVSVNYTTIAGTATAATDFTPVSGTVTIPPNQSVGYIDVPVTGDSLRQADQTFYVQLSNPVNATIAGTGKAAGTIENQGTYLGIDTTGYTTPLSYPGYRLTWSDEFNGTAVDNNNWNYETGGGGWGNNELEYYTNSTNNSYISQGCLVIEARKETIGNNNYTSARLTTQNKKQFTYGRIDIRAKLPVSSGMWPALWMLGSDITTNPWPKCGETDIMELIGTYPARVTGSVHWAQADGTSGTINNNFNLTSGDFSQKFHVYSLLWKQDIIQMYVDDQLYMTARNTDITSGTWPFNNPSFLIFNVAVGGDWPGSPNSSTIFPQRMLVDYVRWFQ
jgi:hypothetical protein